MESFEVTSNKIFSHETPSVATVDVAGLVRYFYSQRHLDRVWSELEAQGHAYYCGPDDIEHRFKVIR